MDSTDHDGSSLLGRPNGQTIEDSDRMSRPIEINAGSMEKKWKRLARGVMDGSVGHIQVIGKRKSTHIFSNQGSEVTESAGLGTKARLLDIPGVEASEDFLSSDQVHVSILFSSSGSTTTCKHADHIQ